MKLIKLLAACALICTSATAVNAATVVRFTGSTAYRGQVETAILYALGSSNGTTLTTGSFAYTNGATATTLGSAGQSIFYGLLGGTGASVTIATDWSGSEGGIQTVSKSVAVPFLPVGSPATTSGTNILASGTDAEIPDVTLSDTYQSSSAFYGYFKGVTYPALQEDANSPVGIVPFKWVASQGAAAGLTNITSQVARQMAYAGYAPLALFTGTASTSGTNTEIDLIGRDPDSGTRLTALAEIGYGIGAQTVNQQEPLDSNGALVTATGSTIVDEAPWPTETTDGITINSPNGGYSSGGKLAGALGSSFNAAAIEASGDEVDGLPIFGGFVGYLSTSDADGTALAAGAVELSYNGVKLGNTGGNYNNAAPLTSGAYTFWGYEHVYYRTSATTGVTTVADAVASQIKNKTAVCFTSSMQVSRASDGQTVLTKY